MDEKMSLKERRNLFCDINKPLKDVWVYILTLFSTVLLCLLLRSNINNFIYTIPNILWWIIGLSLIPGTVKYTFKRKNILPALIGAAILSVLSIDKSNLWIAGDEMPFYFKDILSSLPNNLIRRSIVFLSNLILLKEIMAAFEIIVLQRHAGLLDCKMRNSSTSNQVFKATSAITFFALSFLWITKYFPSGLSNDTWNQWYQIHGEIPLTDLHAPLHTLLMSLLLMIKDSYATVILFQIMCVSLISALLYTNLYKQGIRLSVIMMCSVVFSTSKWCSIYMFPWKDTIYTVLIGASFYMIVWAQQHDFHMPLWRAAFTGILLSLIYLIRYNGIICLILVGTYLCIMLLRQRFIKQAAIIILASVLMIMGTQSLIYNYYGFKKQTNGFSMQVFGAGIAAVVAEKGNVTKKQLTEIDDLLGLDWIYSQYAPWEARSLIWTDETNDPTGYFNQGETSALNNFFVVGLGENKPRIIHLYLSLLIKNPFILVREIGYSTWAIWANYGAFSHASLTLMISLAFFFVSKRVHRKTRLIGLLLPLAANIISIAISTITNEPRYLLPTFLLFAPLILNLLCTIPTIYAPSHALNFQKSNTLLKAE